MASKAPLLGVFHTISSTDRYSGYHFTIYYPYLGSPYILYGLGWYGTFPYFSQKSRRFSLEKLDVVQ